MCGITGMLGATSGGVDDREILVRRMTNSLAHRGPDAEGYWADDNVALGHRRLSILDLSKVNVQPIHSVSGHDMNWEICNHLTMRHNPDTDGGVPGWRGHLQWS